MGRSLGWSQSIFDVIIAPPDGTARNSAEIILPTLGFLNFIQAQVGVDFMVVAKKCSSANKFGPV